MKPKCKCGRVLKHSVCSPEPPHWPATSVLPTHRQKNQSASRSVRSPAAEPSISTVKSFQLFSFVLPHAPDCAVQKPERQYSANTPPILRQYSANTPPLLCYTTLRYQRYCCLRCRTTLSISGNITECRMRKIIFPPALVVSICSVRETARVGTGLFGKTAAPGSVKIMKRSTRNSACPAPQGKTPSVIAVRSADRRSVCSIGRGEFGRERSTSML